MKLFFAEINHHYQKYLFPYQVLLLGEKDDCLADIYQMGFMPFRHRKNLFYLSRSSRCRLEDFSLSSENRRIEKKTAHLAIKTYSTDGFQYTPRVQKYCKIWAKQRSWPIATKSIRHIFNDHFFNQVWVWKDKDEVVGYQVIFKNDNISHVAHVFYNADKEKDLGMRMLLEAVKTAKKEGLEFVYLGTCYGKTGYYKRALAGFEFFNGFSWSSDLAELKFLNGNNRQDYLLRNKKYLKEFWPKGLGRILAQKGIKLPKS